MAEKIVLILSGGLDSVTLLYHLHKMWNVYPLTFHYNQKHNTEIDYAIANTHKLRLTRKHKVIDVSDLSTVLQSALIQVERSVPSIESEQSRTAEVLKQTVVPFRNGIFLSIAAGYAASQKISTIAYAAHLNDYQTYPDCRPSFVNAMERAIREGTDENTVELWTPFIGMNKSEIVTIGENEGVDFTQTWSCYRGGHKHCGNCPSCIERKEAFRGAGVDDPTIYLV